MRYDEDGRLRREHVSITAEDITIDGDLETFRVDTQYALNAHGKFQPDKVRVQVVMYIDPESARRWNHRRRKSLNEGIAKMALLKHEAEKERDWQCRRRERAALMLMAGASPLAWYEVNQVAPPSHRLTATAVAYQETHCLHNVSLSTDCPDCEQ